MANFSGLASFIRDSGQRRQQATKSLRGILQNHNKALYDGRVKNAGGELVGMMEKGPVDRKSFMGLAKKHNLGPGGMKKVMEHVEGFEKFKKMQKEEDRIPFTYFSPVKDKGGNVVDSEKHIDRIKKGDWGKAVSVVEREGNRMNPWPKPAAAAKPTHSKITYWTKEGQKRSVRVKDVNYNKKESELNKMGFTLDDPKTEKATKKTMAEKNIAYTLSKDLRSLTHDKDGNARGSVPTHEVENLDIKAKESGMEVVTVPIPEIVTEWGSGGPDVPATVIYVLAKQGASDEDVKKTVRKQLVSAYGYTPKNALEVVPR